MIKIVFFGSSQHSVTILQKLVSLANFSVVQVVTKQDKPVGRDQKITPNPVAQFARDHHLPLLQITEFTPKVISDIRHLTSDIFLCVAFGPPFFTQEIIDIPKYGIINIHPSPLPKYRGATPGPWQIINGETKSAVSFFLIDAKPDHGPIIAQIPFDISPTETSISFYDKAFALASNNLGTVLESRINHPESATEQDHTQRTYFPKFDKESAQIDWSWDNVKIDRFIRAMLPWPVAWTYVVDQKGNQIKIKIFSAKLEGKELVFDQVQLEGKTRTNWKEIRKYYQITKSAHF
jgi:methionyl-tRNA formyltransferase